MALILALDTSTKVCSVALHEDGCEVGHQVYHLQKSHSALLPSILKELMINCDKSMSDLDAIAVSAGPGSYTGLRIGTSTAKGLCYGMGIPLIAVSGLDAMIEYAKPFIPRPSFICPMIDARRMEVFCSLQSSFGEIIWKPQPKILDDNSFSEFESERIFLVGDGAPKCSDLYSKHDNVHIVEGVYSGAQFLGSLVEAKFNDQQFENLAYFEPDYLKEYRTMPPKAKLT